MYTIWRIVKWSQYNAAYEEPIGFIENEQEAFDMVQRLRKENKRDDYRYYPTQDEDTELLNYFANIRQKRTE